VLTAQRLSGFVVVKDLHEGEPCDVVADAVVSEFRDPNEAPVPQPFEFLE
jgi:hypothetical protein